MPLRLSHSSIELYNLCPKKWHYHYVEKLRSKSITSALFFGGYIGETWQMMILDKKDELNEEEKELVGKDPKEFFNNLMENVEINREKSPLPKSNLVKYYMSDFDEELLTDEDLEQIEEYAQELGMYIEDDRITFSQFREAYKGSNLDDDEFRYMNFHFWLSLRRKGHLMIEEYQNSIMPRIERVHAIEKEINLVCEEDSLIGYIDMVCDWELDKIEAEKLGKEEGDIVKILFDHKTSSANYKKNKIETDAPQLALYDYAEQIGTVGYIVANKKVKRPKIGARKGDTYTHIQVLVGIVPEEEYEKVLDKSLEVLDNVLEERFETNSCRESCFAFQSLCPYYKICPAQENGDDKSYLYRGKK